VAAPPHLLTASELLCPKSGNMRGKRATPVYEVCDVKRSSPSGMSLYIAGVYPISDACKVVCVLVRSIIKHTLTHLDFQFLLCWLIRVVSHALRRTTLRFLSISELACVTPCSSSSARFQAKSYDQLSPAAVFRNNTSTMASTLQPLLDSQNGTRTESQDLSIRVDHIVEDGPHNEPSPRNSQDMDKYHQHYSDRAPWLRAAVLGANDGLVSVASIMLGVSGGSKDKHTLILSGLSALVAGKFASQPDLRF